jgi:hypothetical protein
MPGMASGSRATKISQRKPQIRMNADTVTASTSSQDGGTAISIASAATAIMIPRVERKPDEARRSDWGGSVGGGV